MVEFCDVCSGIGGGCNGRGFLTLWKKYFLLISSEILIVRQRKKNIVI